MAVLNDIREKSPKFIIAGAAIVFIFLIVFDWGLDISGRKGRGGGTGEALGSVNGKEVSYKQFSELVRQTVENQKKQKENEEISDETERQIRSQVWNQMVDELLIEEEIDRLGISVSDQEVRDIVMGPNPPDFLVQQFRDSTGTFRRDRYQEAMMDPQNKEAWIQVENMIRLDQRRRKLQSLLTATVNVSESELIQRFIDRNVTMNADYILFDVHRMVPDSLVTVTEDDLRKQYESHLIDFQTKPSRKVKYVFFSQKPSAADTAEIETEAQRLLDQAKSDAVDFTELVETYSEIPSEEAFFKHGELSQKKESTVFSAKKGEIVGPINDYDGIHIIKILDQRQGTEEFVKASHILFKTVQGPDSTKVIKKAREVLSQARSGADFAQLAREHSEDYGSGQQGGELGWASKDRWVKPFADAAFKARIGDIVGPIRTQFGWHVIKVLGKDKRELKIIDLALKIKASSNTIDEAFRQAEEFSYLAKDEGFEKAAENSKLEIRETPEFNKTGTIPGIGINDAVANFAFTKELGEISEPINMQGGITVIKVSEIREDRFRPMEEVKSMVQSMALKHKKMEKIREQVDTFYKTLTPSTDFVAAVQSMSNVIVKNTGTFKPIENVSGVGRDLNFIGTALALKSGEISKPIEGIRGYYIIKMLLKTELDTVKYNQEREILSAQLLQEKRNRVVSDWQTSIREKADIIDNRSKFFR